MSRTAGLYLLVLVALATVMFVKSVPPVTKAEPAMNWSEIKDGIVVPAKPTGIWTWAFDYVQGPALISIEAEGSWKYSGTQQCGPDGQLNGLVGTANLILPGAPLGALLVKVGGSTAGVNDGVVRVAGTRAVVTIDEKASGPVFLTINDELTGLSDNDGQLKVKLSIARIAAPPAAPKAATSP
ncbi:MAG: hypothetical protein ABWZ85_03975 [Luteibacter sp.]